MAMRENKTGYKGVKFSTRYNNYEATICINGHETYLGVRKTAREAALLYDLKAIQFGKATNILKLKK